MIASIKKTWHEKPLLVALVAGGFFRLLAVIFSKGFGMHDDHFLVIEAAQSWVDGYDYNNWLPSSGATVPGGHSFFYVGLHYLILKGLHFVSITDPDTKMYIIRFLHALLSMAVIVLAYKIVNRYSDKKQAGLAALLMAILFFMPWFSVRNLVEVVCVPCLMYATWLIIKAQDKQKGWLFFAAGLMAGLAFSVRFQCLFFVGGMGLYLITLRAFKPVLLFGVGALLVMGLTQGLIDYCIWGYPFAEFTEYVLYNMANAFTYFTKPWYMYLVLIAGILIPPISLFLFFGYLRSWKKYLLIFLPSFIFLAYHSYFPNKQERFIFPVIPFIIMSGVMGWHEFKNGSRFWQRRVKLYRGFWIFFWVINSIPLVLLSVSYLKKDRVEAMRYLSKKDDLTSLLIEDRNHDEFILPTLYYLGKWPQVYGLTQIQNYDSLKYQLSNIPFEKYPNYVVFIQDDNLDQRLVDFKAQFGNLSFETTVKGGLLDATMHWLNPVNKYQHYHIYKISYPDSVKIKSEI